MTVCNKLFCLFSKASDAGLNLGLKTEPCYHSEGKKTAHLVMSCKCRENFDSKNYFLVESACGIVGGAGGVSVMSTTSISNIRFWLGAIFGGMPCAPYPITEGI